MCGPLFATSPVAGVHTCLLKDMSYDALWCSRCSQPMLHKLNPEVLARLALEMKPIRISKGDVIIDAGEPGFEMYFLISGNLEVCDVYTMQL